MLVGVPESQCSVSMQAWVIEARRTECAALHDDFVIGAPHPPAVPITREQALDIALFHEGEERVHVPSSLGLLSPSGEAVIVDAEMRNDQRDIAHLCVADIAVEGDEADIIEAEWRVTEVARTVRKTYVIAHLHVCPIVAFSVDVQAVISVRGHVVVAEHERHRSFALSQRLP